ncbi:MAG: M23 family metallopeptidase [Acidimicrobiia bacterium]|nr:M23 family metallopeptidase [Acidimicrobiia bacterium]
MSKTRAIILVAVATTLLIATAIPARAVEDFRLDFFPHEDTESHFTNDWGDSRPGGRSHQGTDVFGEKHSAVVAVADGFVMGMKESYRAGYNIRIAHRDGWESWYMHLNNDTPGTNDGAAGAAGAFAPGLEIGMYVPAGTIIGYIGNSGNAEGGTAHTHFELHNGRRAVNPYPYLADAFERWERVRALTEAVSRGLVPV